LFLLYSLGREGGESPKLRPFLNAVLASLQTAGPGGLLQDLHSCSIGKGLSLHEALLGNYGKFGFTLCYGPVVNGRSGMNF